MSKAIELLLKYKGKIVAHLKISPSGFIFMKVVSRPELDWQNYRYFENTGCPVWDEVELAKLEPKLDFYYSKAEVKKIVEGVLQRALFPKRGYSPVRDIAEQIYCYLAIQKIGAEHKKQPEPCKTCGGSREVPTRDKWGAICSEEMKPCPDCQEPEPSEKAKRFRKLLDTQDKSVIVKEGCEAADAIDSQQADFERLKEDFIRVSSALHRGDIMAIGDIVEQALSEDK